MIISTKNHVTGSRPPRMPSRTPRSQRIIKAAPMKPACGSDPKLGTPAKKSVISQTAK